MKYRRPSGRAGQDRWLMSYADLVTLLFACFTTAYAASMSPADAPPLEPAPVVAEEAVVAETEEDETHAMVGEAGKEEAGKEEPLPPVPPVPTLRDQLTPSLAGGLDGVEIELIEDARGLVISLPDTATFASGRADLTAAARGLLLRIADVLHPTGASIRIEGHTDDTAVRGGRYGSNWELSTARASAVVVYMVTEAGLEPARLSAAGYGEFHPRASNGDAASRALNRRVDLVVIEAAGVDGAGR